MTKLFIPFVLLVGLFSGCSKEPSQQETVPPVTVDVKVAAVKLGSIDETVTASGTIANLRESQLRSPINGVITRFQCFNGDAINTGDIVAVIRTKESQSSILGAEKLLRSASTPSQREEAEKALSIAKENSNDATVASPFPGILNNKIKNETELVSEGEPIASVIDPKSIVFVADVPSRVLSSIKKNQPTVVHFPMIKGKIFHGTVIRIEPLLNPNDQTAHVQIAFGESVENLQRSLFGDATFIVGKKSNIILAPIAALLQNDEDNSTSIMVVGKDSLAHKIEVQVGTRQDSVVEISSRELSPGTLVIVQGHYGLPDSTHIRIIQ